jgi:hypothetical protein
MSDTNAAIAEREDQADLNDTETTTETKEPAEPAGPSAQVLRLGGDFAAVGVDVRLHQILRMVQKGTPTKSMVPVQRRETTTVIDPETKEEKQETKEVTVHEPKVDWEWGPMEQVGDPLPSVTKALRAQAEDAKSYRTPEKGSYLVKEYISTEYGVWYVTDPDGVKEGYRFSIALGARKPAPPPKEKKERVKKEPRPKAEKPPKATKQPKAATKSAASAVAPENVVTADDIDVSDE